jgi:hypothetical protein
VTDNSANWNTAYGWGNHVDNSVTNEGLLDVGTGTAYTSQITSNTSSSPIVTLKAGSNIALSESADTIMIAATGLTSGTVTSVGLAAPTGEFDITNSPVTSTGTLTLAWDQQTTNKVFVAPNGSTGVPTFRTLVAADVPAHNSLTGYISQLHYYQKNIDTVKTSLTGLVKATAGLLSTVTDNSANWNTAYGWGNHASAGYLTAEVDGDVDNEGVLTVAAGGATDARIRSNSAGGHPGIVLAAGSGMTISENDSTITFTVSAGGGNVTKVGTPADSQVGVWTGDGTIEGTNNLWFDGNLGIATTIPSEKLQVNGEVRATALNDMVFIDLNNPINILSITGQLSSYALTLTGSSHLNQDLRTTDNPTFAKGKFTSNVSIGTTLPTEMLDIIGNVDITGSYMVNGTPLSAGGNVTAVPTPLDNQVAVWASGTTIDGSTGLVFDGNLGIGSTIPSTKLDVNGVITATGGNSGNWNTAYGWGNHASAGYLTTLSLDGLSDVTITSAQNDQVLLYDDGVWINAAAPGGGGGTVTSVGLALPAEITITNSPVTTSGTLTGTWADKNANLIFASPNGSSGTPSFRSLVAADVPVPTTITVADESADASGYILFVTTATGNLAPKTNSKLVYDADDDELRAAYIYANKIETDTLIADEAVRPDVNDGALLGTSNFQWSGLYIAESGFIDFDNNDLRLTQTGNELALSGGDLALGVNNLTMSGSIGVTGTRVLKGWFTDITCTNAISGSITGNAATVTTNANLTGDVTSVGNATTIGATKVTASMLNANVISGQTDLGSGIATTDEILLSDAGVLKKADVSILGELYSLTGHYHESIYSTDKAAIITWSTTDIGFYQNETEIATFYAGNLGLGITDPTHKLSVTGTAYVSGNVGIGYTNPSGKTATLAVSGNIGIGTTTPNWALEVYNPTTNTTDYGMLLTYGAGYAGAFRREVDNNANALFLFQKSRGSVGSPATVVPGDAIGQMAFEGYHESTWNRLAHITATCDDTTNLSTTKIGGYLQFNTMQASGSATSERMRITSAGFVGIGSTVPVQLLDVGGSVYVKNNVGIGTTVPAAVLAVNGVAQFYNNFKQPIETITTTTTIAVTHGIILGNMSDGTKHLDIPAAAATFMGMIFWIKNIGANNFVLDFPGGSREADITMTSNDFAMLTCDGNDWYIMGYAALP